MIRLEREKQLSDIEKIYNSERDEMISKIELLKETLNRERHNHSIAIDDISILFQQELEKVELGL